MKNELTRRKFIKDSLTTAGFVVAVTAIPGGCAVSGKSEMAKKDLASFKPNAWFEITSENKVIITIGQSELGQGTHTSLAMVVADELEADWDQVEVLAGGANYKFNNPFFPIQLTGGSLSIRSFYHLLRKLGAGGRAVLIEAAAKTWNVPASECAASRGTIVHEKSGRKLTYGELAEAASKLKVPKKPKLKSDDQLRIIGTTVPRVDVPAKARGEGVFSLDFNVPGMVYAVVDRPLAYGAKPKTFDQSEAEKVKGVLAVLPIDSGIAVCATSLDAAWKGKEALNTDWGDGTLPDLDSKKIEAKFLDELDMSGAVLTPKVDVKSALSQAARTVSETYYVPYVAHATLEPMNCTASVQKDRCDVWAPTQFQSLVKMVGQKVSGLSSKKVHVHSLYTGGGFGRRLEVDFVVESLVLSKIIGKPVKVVWTREEDMQNDFYRAACAHRVTVGLNGSGGVIGWQHKVVSPSINERFFPVLVQNGVDISSTAGIFDPSPGGNASNYAIPNMHVELKKMDLPVPVGNWRSVCNAANAFVMETIIDDLARKAGVDPVEYRLPLLQKNKRALRVLETVVEKSNWGQSMPGVQGRGIAQHFCFGGYAAHVADVSVDKKSGKIKVHKIVTALDCGMAVNPKNIEMQMEGGITMALSTALKEEVLFSRGGVESANYDDYPILRMSETPEIEVHIINSQDPIGGVGEPPVPPTAPAVANAVFDAIGVRLRRLPMSPNNVRAAIKGA
jgi:isoquinoline 1-oxidoreductase subunit beta